MRAVEERMRLAIAHAEYRFYHEAEAQRLAREMREGGG